MDISVEHPGVLYLLIMLPLVAWLLYYWREKRIQTSVKIASPELLPRISMHPSYRYRVRNILMVAGLGLAIVALANPRIPGPKVAVKQESADVFIALDISRSMLAKDVAPDRMSRARHFLTLLIDQLKGERIGLIAFAGSAYLLIPLTNDYTAARELIQSANTDMAGTQGTAIGEAIRLAQKTFTKESTRSKGLIILTDGEDHDSDALTATREAAAEGIVITTLGVGTQRGSMIVARDNSSSNFLLDSNGEPVRSKLNESILREIAGKAQGEYFNIRDEDKALAAIKTMVGKLDRGEYKKEETANYTSLYAIFLLPAFLLFITEYLIGLGIFYRKPKVQLQ